MKSKLFSKQLWLENEDFKKDIKRISNLDERINKELPSVVAKILLSSLSSEDDKIFDESAKRLGIDESILRSNKSIVANFIKEFAPVGDAANDSIEDLIDDIKESGLLESTDLNSIKSMLKSAKKVSIEDFHKAQQKKSYEHSGLPKLVGITEVVDLRVIFDKKYESDSSIKDYSPVCEGLVPMAVVKLRFSKDSPTESVCFQMTRKEIKMVKDHFEALEKQIEKATKFANLKPS
ncbi:hypothetical protein KJ966_15270 [bacterium]|nr:hypothetical protein [bacterium]